MVIKYSKRIALYLTSGPKAMMRKSNVIELTCAVFLFFFLAKRDISEIWSSSHLGETLKWEIVFMMIFLCKLFCSVELIDWFLCLSGSSFCSEILDGVSWREAKETGGCSLERMVSLRWTPLYGAFQEMGPNTQEVVRVLNSVAEWPNCSAIQTS